MELWFVAGCAVLLGAVLQRLSGTGVGLVVAPILSLLIGPGPGVLVTNATTTVSGFLIMLAVRHDVDWATCRRLCLAAAVGAVPGALIVRELALPWLQVVVGGVVLLAVATTVAVRDLPHIEGAGATALAGLIGGLLNTTAGVAAPAMVIYSRLRRWPQETFAATMQPVFMTMGALSVLLKTVLGSVPSSQLPPWWTPPAIVILVVVGSWVGGRLARVVPVAVAGKLAVTLALLGGASALIRGSLALLGG
ncbi:TSUP family transporter [Gephyromycinifex aptenodytis]|uniref:TSUP family transporter n=1 Tax=Gephyromycinifex aptenodytis TaxID=2716227 RepID=UPI0014478063|nr:TSUP family transporter [Gephyromycinifex aptenodytis]